MSDKIAVLVDGGFTKSKLASRLGRLTGAADIQRLCRSLLAHDSVREYAPYRIFYYDAAPYEETRKHPVSGRTTNYRNTEIARENRRLLYEIGQFDHFALRLGTVIFEGWKLADSAVDKLARDDPLAPQDVLPNIHQSGVDMRLGLDIAWLAGRGLAQALLLVTGDSDLIPAMKLARREGLQVVLFPFEHHVKPELRVHADVIIPASEVSLPE